MKSVVLGMSGGVDSSVSAILLKEQGYNVIGVTMELIENDGTNAKDAKNVCDRLGIEHHVIHLEDIFKEKVIKRFMEEYQNCRTPNPCIYCNRYLKFGVLYEYAKELGADFVATGHYAKKEFSEEYNRDVIVKSDAGRKDQTYVLCWIEPEMVEHILFPLGSFKSKDEIREIARIHGLGVASKSDSEDICFIPDGDYVNYLDRHNIQGMRHGMIVDNTGKILGKHQGLHRYTIGQRRGMGISSSTPLYVIKLKKEKNQLIVGKEEELFTDTLLVEEPNFLIGEYFRDGMEVDAKIRYSAKEVPAIVKIHDNNTLIVKFKDKVRAVTPGQAIAFYIGNTLVGGGIIANS